MSEEVSAHLSLVRSYTDCHRAKIGSWDIRMSVSAIRADVQANKYYFSIVSRYKLLLIYPRCIIAP